VQTRHPGLQQSACRSIFPVNPDGASIPHESFCVNSPGNNCQSNPSVILRKKQLNEITIKNKNLITGTHCARFTRGQRFQPQPRFDSLARDLPWIGRWVIVRSSGNMPAAQLNKQAKTNMMARNQSRRPSTPISDREPK
jgi:hypothetical protein